MRNGETTPNTTGELAVGLLGWYDRHRRRLPWRALPGERVDPYLVWLSEIMLQQTTVATVGPYFEAFLGRWPTVESLAGAELDQVLHQWQGLGYYARARNLHKCAGIVASEHGGRLPETEAELLELPGIGPYTAAAIAAIAFERPAVVVDGNVERVMARLHRVTEPLPGSKLRLKALAAGLTPGERSGDYAQAVMDLGATVCVPKAPKCTLCPWGHDCAGRDIAERLPARKRNKPRPTRRGLAFWLTRADGAVLLRRRPESGLLGGMMEVPSTEWREGRVPGAAKAGGEAPLPATAWRRLPGLVEHTFTHFHLELGVLAGRVKKGARAPKDCLWCPPGRLGDHALPTVMKKVAAHSRQKKTPSRGVREDEVQGG
ncbi:MAG: A/G-specific adenine glycosylase [Alphaproteobacteria bacterium]|mgnify:CR=1 FL=1|jgi:A/G-specific adenine glycosylase|nr:A/G-specific adenine glycosylase [Alphaproteobacteria bacterium]